MQRDKRGEERRTEVMSVWLLIEVEEVIVTYESLHQFVDLYVVIPETCLWICIRSLR